tara:strand:+ start:301 stop:636 length:336 start_codon:yes stop_codon:yes gene_type:complete
LAIPEGEEIYEYWKQDERSKEVKIIHFLGDLNQPYSCSQWGYSGTPGIPPYTLVTSKEGYSIRDLFPLDPVTEAQYPITIFINRNMQIINIAHINLTLEETNLYINCMLDS